MYEIEETRDIDLICKGLRWKVVEERRDGTTAVVGYFSDHRRSELVRDALDATAPVAPFEDDDHHVNLGPVS